MPREKRSQALETLLGRLHSLGKPGDLFALYEDQPSQRALVSNLTNLQIGLLALVMTSPTGLKVSSYEAQGEVWFHQRFKKKLGALAGNLLSTTFLHLLQAKNAIDQQNVSQGAISFDLALSNMESLKEVLRIEELSPRYLADIEKGLEARGKLHEAKNLVLDAMSVIRKISLMQRIQVIELLFQRLAKMLGLVEAFTIETVNIQVLVQEIQASPICIQLAQKHSVSVEVEQGLPTVQADSMLLVGAIENCLRNSQEAMPPQPEKMVTVRAKLVQRGQKERYLCFEIEDQGHGIAPDMLPRIFTPGVTTKPERRGLKSIQGIGLTTVLHTIIELHHGIIEVESNQTKLVITGRKPTERTEKTATAFTGTRVKLLIPLAQTL